MPNIYKFVESVEKASADTLKNNMLVSDMIEPLKSFVEAATKANKSLANSEIACDYATESVIENSIPIAIKNVDSAISVANSAADSAFEAEQAAKKIKFNAAAALFKKATSKTEKVFKKLQTLKKELVKEFKKGGSKTKKH